MAAWNRGGLLAPGREGRKDSQVISIAQGKEGVLSQHLLPKAGSPTQGHSTAPI